MLVGISPHAQSRDMLRVGVALPEGNSMVGLPAIAESLSAETLIGLDADGRPLPRIAERWAVSPDGRDLRFVVTPNLLFHNGSRADAPTLAALVRSALQRSGALQFHPRLRDFYEISAEGPLTLRLRSRSPRVLALEELADLTLKTGSPDSGLGPFVVDSLSAEGIRLHGFQQYFKGAPAIRRIEFQVYRSQRAAWTGMMRGDTDALYEVNREAVDFVEQQQSRVRTHSFFRAYVAALLFNVSRPQFRDPNIRVALAAAVDRASIVRAAYRGRARVAEGPLAPTYWGLSGEVRHPEFDPAKAASLLKPYKLTARAGEMPARLRFRCLVPTFETQPLERTALVIQRQLYAFGVDVQLELISVRELLPRLASGNFDAVLMEFYGATPSWLSYFWHSAPRNSPVLISSGYSAADAELEVLDSARSEEELRSAVTRVYAKLFDDPPAIFIAWPEVTRAVVRRFDVPVEPGRDIMGANLWLWRPAGQH
jgi:peptide/nickel transport system substrate-binding protein